MLYGSRINRKLNPQTLGDSSRQSQVTIARSSHGFSLHQLPGPDLEYFV